MNIYLMKSVLSVRTSADGIFQILGCLGEEPNKHKDFIHLLEILKCGPKAAS